MVKYKRYRRRRGASTRVIKMKFQSFMDINTSATSMQILTVSAGGANVLKRLAPQFGAYKYYKLGSVSVKLVPASTLPVDPTGLSYEAGENSVDPRDQLTPGMMRITNGEDIFENISGLSDEAQHAIYNNMLLDPRWFKWMLQSGVKRYATPRYWQIGQLHQDKWPGAHTNFPVMSFADPDWTMQGTGNTPEYLDGSATPPTMHTPVSSGSSHLGLFQVGHSGRLGWMPTDGLAEIGQGLQKPFVASPPEVEVMKIILPKAYKTEYYYRMFVTETVFFKEPIVNYGITDSLGFDYRPLDIFHTPGRSVATLPTEPMRNYFPEDSQTGGNYGDD